MPSITTIHLTPIQDPGQVLEALVLGTPTPGYLVELTSAGKVQAHSTASGINTKTVLLENQATADVIDTAYTAGETARYMNAKPGDIVYMFLADAVATTANTTNLVSNGDGTLKAAAGTEVDELVVGLALETVTASGETRIKVRAY